MANLLNQIFQDQKKESQPVENMNDSSNYICFKVQGLNFYCNIDAVKEVIECSYIAPYPIKLKGHIGITNVRGKIIPVIHDVNFNWSILTEINSLQGQHKYRLLVFEQNDGGQFSLIISEVFKIKMENSQSEIIQVNEQPYRYFDFEFFLKNTIGKAS